MDHPIQGQSPSKIILTKIISFWRNSECESIPSNKFSTRVNVNMQWSLKNFVSRHREFDFSRGHLLKYPSTSSLLVKLYFKIFHGHDSCSFSTKKVSKRPFCKNIYSGSYLCFLKKVLYDIGYIQHNDKYDHRVRYLCLPWCNMQLFLQHFQFESLGPSTFGLQDHIR